MHIELAGKKLCFVFTSVTGQWFSLKRVLKFEKQQLWLPHSNWHQDIEVIQLQTFEIGGEYFRVDEKKSIRGFHYVCCAWHLAKNLGKLFLNDNYERIMDWYFSLKLCTLTIWTFQKQNERILVVSGGTKIFFFVKLLENQLLKK